MNRGLKSELRNYFNGCAKVYSVWTDCDCITIEFYNMDDYNRYCNSSVDRDVEDIINNYGGSVVQFDCDITVLKLYYPTNF